MHRAIPALIAAVVFATNTEACGPTPSKMQPGVEDNPVCARVHEDYRVDCNWLAAKPPVKVAGPAGREGTTMSGEALARQCNKKFKPGRKLRACYRN